MDACNLGLAQGQLQEGFSMSFVDTGVLTSGIQSGIGLLIDSIEGTAAVSIPRDRGICREAISDAPRRFLYAVIQEYGFVSPMHAYHPLPGS